MARVSFQWDDEQLRQRTSALPADVHRAVAGLMDYHATLGEAHMKETAPWTDRTGAARVGLHTAAESAGTRHTIIFAHSVHYGIWLEVKNSGRYEVIMPSTRFVGQMLMANLQGLLGRMG